MTETTEGRIEGKAGIAARDRWRLEIEGECERQRETREIRMEERQRA